MEVKNQEKKCWELKDCSEDKRSNCSAYKAGKNCWEVMTEVPKVQCADRLKDCAFEKCPVFMEYASEITAAWISHIRTDKTSK